MPYCKKDSIFLSLSISSVLLESYIMCNLTVIKNCLPLEQMHHTGKATMLKLKEAAGPVFNTNFKPTPSPGPLIQTKDTFRELAC